MTKKKLELKSIKEEAAACRKAFVGVKAGRFVLHCHHGIIIEDLYGGPRDRIAHILRHKHVDEQALRLRLFRPLPANIMRTKLAAAVNRLQREATLLTKKVDRLPYGSEYKKVNDKAERLWDRHAKAETKFINAVHKKYCDPNCLWNGETIFPAT